MSTGINFQHELDNVLKSIKNSGSAPALLLHSCCGPCSSYVVSYLMEYFDITLFFYNPNIFPESEFFKRLDAQKKLIDSLNSDDHISYELNGKAVERKRLCDIKLYVPEYDHSEFLDAVAGLESEPEGGKRCEECFRLRLGRAYKYASEKGFDYFASTLSVSPHKDAVLLNSIGEGFEHGRPAYLISDFKKREGYKSSIILSKQFDLYRQNYCGCEFARF